MIIRQSNIIFPSSLSLENQEPSRLESYRTSYGILKLGQIAQSYFRKKDSMNPNEAYMPLYSVSRCHQER